MASAPARERRSQAERSEEMRQRLVDATIASLIENGYARTTAVEVCRRAGVTRGALHHHFADLPALLAAAMSDAYERYFVPRSDRPPPRQLDDWVDAAWQRLRRPEFKAVIEVWLAARNDPEMAGGLRPAIDKYKQIFSIDRSEVLQRWVGGSREARAFYRLAAETMIGLALGRATTPGGAPVDHERTVIDLLRTLARRIER